MTPNRERDADSARRRLQETEQRADETLEQAAEELQELTEEQEATADRLRKEVREPTGPLLRREPEKDDE